MRRFLIGGVFVFVLIVSGIAIAADCPKLNGADVLIPKEVIGAIPGFNPDKPVYAACDENGWFSIKGKITDTSKERTRMVNEGAYWRARNMANKRFHPVQLSTDGNPTWALLETVYKLTEPCIDTSGSGPCFLIK
jgi:hypothetical protein